MGPVSDTSSDKTIPAMTRLEPDLWDRLAQSAEEADRSMSKELRRAVVFYLERKEGEG